MQIKAKYFFNKHSNAVLWLVIAGYLLPILALVAVGVYTLWQQQLFGVLLAMMLLLSLASLVYCRIQQMANPETIINRHEKGFVEPSVDWSSQELQLWEALNTRILSYLNTNDDWSELKAYGLLIASETASAFEKKDLDFSISEALQMLEEISRRYRLVLAQHLPSDLLHRVKLSHLQKGYELNDKYGDTIVSITGALQYLRRIARLINPVNAIIGELKDHISSQVFEELKGNLLFNSKRALLQEVASVCIDLYSGRFLIDETRIGQSSMVKQDNARQAPELEPLRVVIIGQTNAGKSSLVNSLAQDAFAEVDSLPSTNQVQTYRYQVDGREALRLIDTPSLDSDPKTLSKIQDEIIQADLVLWLLKANQSARQLDQELRVHLDSFYAAKENISRKKPKFIAVLNQIDRLKPTSEWRPPYSLDNPQVDKEKSILAALNYNQELLNFDIILPLALPENMPQWGLENLEDVIEKAYLEGKNIQRNRQRLAAMATDDSWFEQGKQLFKGIAVLAKGATLK